MNVDGSQPLPQDEEQPKHQEQNQQKKQSSWGIKFMLGYLYFAQGFIFSISTTVPYVYSKLPDYFTLSLFSLSSLPFSLKFITAPFLQKYSNISYGKRKTWIVFSQTLTLLSLIALSFITDLDQAKAFAILCFFMYLGLCLQDISLDALCLKQLSSSKQMSTIQAGCQTAGGIIGGLVLLKFTSLQFANRLGRTQPITSLQSLLLMISVGLLIPSILIHFLFHQKHIPSDSRANKQSIWKIYSIYRYFFKRGYRYFYVLVFFLIYPLGFNFFSAGYNYELVNKGFSKDTMNSIDNIQTVITTLLVFIVGKKAYVLGYKNTYLIINVINWIVYLYLWVFFPTQLWPVIISSFFINGLTTWDFLMSSAMSGDFPDAGATGMLYTMSSSAANLGKLLFIQTAVLKKLPWKWVSFGGLILQLGLIIFFIPKMIDLINVGKTDLDILDEDEQSQNQKNIGNNLKQIQQKIQK